ncbi:MAG: uroporphyrinogen decarboxylase family protein [Armatimonadota bacterium]
MTRKEILEHTLRGKPSGTIPAAPLYMGLYCEPIRRRKMAEVLREMAAGRETMHLSFEDHLEAELEAWARTWQQFDTPPDWMRCKFGTSRTAAEGSTVTVTENECIWESADGSREINYGVEYDATAGSSVDVWDKDVTINTDDDIKALVPVREAEQCIGDGQAEFIQRAIDRWSDDFLLKCNTGTPFWGGYSLFGFAGLMHMLHDSPEILSKVFQRVMQARLSVIRAYYEAGLRCLFVEECLTGSDIISVDDYERLAWPFMRDMLAAAVDMGFVVVFYHTGAIEGRLPFLSRCPAHAVAFEEEKKTINIDLAEIRDAVGPQKAIYGNLDVTALRDASKDAITAEIARQKETAGEPFVASVGSPVTLDTPPHRVSWIAEAAREISR